MPYIGDKVEMVYFTYSLEPLRYLNEWKTKKQEISYLVWKASKNPQNVEYDYTYNPNNNSKSRLLCSYQLQAMLQTLYVYSYLTFKNLKEKLCFLFRNEGMEV